MSENNVQCMITKLPDEQFNKTVEGLAYENVNHFKACPPCFERFMKLNAHRTVRVKRSDLVKIDNTRDTL